jgi:hypothetical protein
MVDGAVIALDFEPELEAERTTQPVDRGVRVVVEKRKN